MNVRLLHSYAKKMGDAWPNGSNVTAFHIAKMDLMSSQHIAVRFILTCIVVGGILTLEKLNACSNCRV